MDDDTKLAIALSLSLKPAVKQEKLPKRMSKEEARLRKPIPDILLRDDATMLSVIKDRTFQV